MPAGTRRGPDGESGSLLVSVARIFKERAVANPKPVHAVTGNDQAPGFWTRVLEHIDGGNLGDADIAHVGDYEGGALRSRPAGLLDRPGV